MIAGGAENRAGVGTKQLLAGRDDQFSGELSGFFRRKLRRPWSRFARAIERIAGGHAEGPQAVEAHLADKVVVVAESVAPANGLRLNAAAGADDDPGDDQQSAGGFDEH